MDAVSALLSSFPPALCALPATAAAAAAHLRTVAFREAPRRARDAAVALAAADAPSLSAGLAALHEGLFERAARPELLECAEISPPQLDLLRALFVCTVLLLEAVHLARASDLADAADAAAASLRGLGCVPIGAVALPQLIALEDRLLGLLADSGILVAVLLEHAASGTARRGGGGGGGGGDGSGDARCALALRWSSAALSSPRLAPQLWPHLPVLLEASSRLRVGGGLSEAAALGGTCAALVHSALSSLAVEDPEQRACAAGLLGHLGARCAEELRRSQQRRRQRRRAPPLPFTDDAEAAAPAAAASGRAASPRALVLCALLFSLLASIKESLLPPLLHAARELLLLASGAADGAPSDDGADEEGWRCAVLLRNAVSAAAPGARKERLLDWLHGLRREGRTVDAPSAVALAASHSL